METIPAELYELIIARLSNKDCFNFLQIIPADILKCVLWTRVFEYHFGKKYHFKKNKYLRYLNIERFNELIGEYLSLCVHHNSGYGYNLTEILNTKRLFIHADFLRKIPPEIGELLKLKCLHINNYTKQNQITMIPEEIYSLNNLGTLMIRNVQMREIPKEISRLKHLKFLNLRENLISEIPSELFSLINLTDLIFDENQIKEIPKEIYRLENLKFISFDYNMITKIPIEIFKMNITGIRLNSNQIEEIPKDISLMNKLQNLQLAKNKIKKIPIVIDSMVKLHQLVLYGNPIENIYFKILENYNEWKLNFHRKSL